MTNPPDREVAVFGAALRLPPAERKAYLDEACAGDAALRQRIVELLQASGEAGNFLESPAEVPPGGTIRLTGLPTEKPGDRIGRYKLLQQIGEGGCGVVYMAEQEEPVRRRVALKVIKLGMDTKQVIARFEAERQALALMDHPNIAKVLDAGATETGRPYFVMELVRGIKITDYCDENNLSTMARLELFVQVCKAIQHAHQKGIIHRDIKPSNILVADHDGVPVPKVIDFGIAKATTDQRLTDKTLFTAFEQFIGTPAYMSPEQARLSGLDIDTRSDIYSLGVLLYELLTGQTPFNAKELLQAGLDEIRRVIREQEPARPSTCLSTMLGADLTAIAKHRNAEPPKLIHLVRGDLDWIVMKALEKDRTRRYETANGLAADIQRHLGNEPVVACPPGNLYKFQKLVRRNKLAFVAVSAVAVALALGVVASTAEAIRARRAEQQQSRLREIAEQSQRVEAQQRREAEAARAEEARQRGIASEQEMLARRRFYAAQMNLANQAWEAGHFARTLDLLETQQPHLGEPDLRSFEWCYLWGLCNGRLLHTIRAHSSTVEGVAFSPDGTTLASDSDDGTIYVWDTATGHRRLLLTPTRNAPMEALAFSPDGKTLASGDTDTLVKLWDSASGKLRATLSGEPLSSRLPAGQSHWIRSLVFSPDGKVLASGCDPESDGTVVKLWDLATDQVLTSLKGNKGPVIAMAFSPDGSTLAAGSGWGDDGGACFIWSLTNGTYQSSMNLGKADSLSFAPDGKTLAATSWDEIRLWDATTWKLQNTLKGHTGAIGGLSFLPDSHSLVSCGTDRTIRLWPWPVDAPTNFVSRVIGAHLDAATHLAVTRDGSMLATGANDGTVKLWNIADHDVRQDSQASAEFKFGDDGGWHILQSVLPLPDRKRVLVVTRDGAELRDLESGRKLASWTDAAGCGVLSADGKLLATGQKDGALKLWDVAAQKLIASVKTEFGTPVLAFSPDGRTLAAGGAADIKGGSRLIRMWDVAAGLKSVRTIDTSNASIDDLCFFPDGKTLAAASGNILLFDALTGQTSGIIRIADQMNVGSMVLSPDGRILATGREGGVVCLWDAQTGELLKELKGHASTVYTLAFSPDGGTLASGGEDATVRLWDVQTGQERVTLTSSNSQSKVSALAFPDGSTLVTGFEDGSVIVRRGIHNPEADVESVAVENRDAKAAFEHATLLIEQGKLAEAEASCREAIALYGRLAHDDPSGSEYFIQLENSQWQLADVLVKTGRRDQAGTTAREAAQECHLAMAQYGELASDLSRHQECWNFAISYETLGGFLAEIGQTQEAENAYRDAQALWRKLVANFNTEDYRFHLAVNDDALGNLLSASGRAVESLELKRDAQAIWLKSVAESNLEDRWAHLGWTDEDIGQLLTAAGRFDEAAEAYRQALAVWKKLSADFDKQDYRDHLSRTLVNLATTLQSAGKRTEAGQFLREAAEHADVQTLNGLAWILATSPDSNLRDGANAVVFAEKAVAATNRKQVGYLDTLAAAYAETGQFAKAIGIAQEAIALSQSEQEKTDLTSRLKLYENNAPYRDDGELAQLVMVRLREGKFAEAEPIARECLRIREIQIPDNWRTFNARSMLGGSLLGQKKYAEAEPLLRSGYEGMKQREAIIPPEGKPRLGETLQRLVQLYEATGRPGQADDWRKKLAEFDQTAAGK